MDAGDRRRFALDSFSVSRGVEGGQAR